MNWDTKVSPCLLDNRQVKLVLEKHFASHGHALTLQDISSALQNEKTLVASKRGLCTGMVCSPTKKTSRNYLAYVATNTEIAISKKVRLQTRNRFVSETSLRSCCSYLMTIATTHLFVGQSSTVHANINEDSDGAKNCTIW